MSSTFCYCDRNQALSHTKPANPAKNPPPPSETASQEAVRSTATTKMPWLDPTHPSGVNLSLVDPEKKKVVERYDENPLHKNQKKPWPMPWKPRDWLPAFCFVPPYLEVNQKICSAVYLRHPVARPGLAEVPTPFANETMALAFNWYLRRR